MLCYRSDCPGLKCTGKDSDDCAVTYYAKADNITATARATLASMNYVYGKLSTKPQYNWHVVDWLCWQNRCRLIFRKDCTIVDTSIP